MHIFMNASTLFKSTVMMLKHKLINWRFNYFKIIASQIFTTVSEKRFLLGFTTIVISATFHSDGHMWLCSQVRNMLMLNESLITKDQRPYLTNNLTARKHSQQTWTNNTTRHLVELLVSPKYCRLFGTEGKLTGLLSSRTTFHKE